MSLPPKLKTEKTDGFLGSFGPNENVFEDSRDSFVAGRFSAIGGGGEEKRKGKKIFQRPRFLDEEELKRSSSPVTPLKLSLSPNEKSSGVQLENFQKKEQKGIELAEMKKNNKKDKGFYDLVFFCFSRDK